MKIYGLNRLKNNLNRMCGNKLACTTLLVVTTFGAIPTVSAQESSEGPVSLRSDIRIEHYMEVAPQSIRLAQDPVSGDLYYNTNDGGIHRIVEQGESEQLWSVEDHGIPRMQGLAFHGEDLFAVGNQTANEGLGSVGMIMRGRLQSDGSRTWSLVAKTVEHGGAQTVFDHGFNGIVIDPSGDYMYVNSGARTDHGEVQHNNENYPGQREVPTTAVLFRLPIDTQDLILTHEPAQVDPYIFVKGVRNIYDLEFAPNGHLFGVSNSGDYDHPEDMWWLREGRHYGFPWVMGGIRNPQQDPGWHPDPEVDLLLPRFSHAYNVGYFRNDPDFPQKPDDLVITPSVQNIGPDADYYRDPETGEIRKASDEGKTIGTFSAHRSPLGLVFDHDGVLGSDLTGDGFVLGHNGMRTGMSQAFGGAAFGEQEGRDLMHLELIHSPVHDNYLVRVTRIAGEFPAPTDALMLGNEIYVINYGRGESSSIWKVILPTR